MLLIALAGDSVWAQPKVRRTGVPASPSTTELAQPTAALNPGVRPDLELIRVEVWVVASTTTTSSATAVLAHTPEAEAPSGLRS